METLISSDPKLTEIIEKIVAAVHPTKIYLFGSRVRGDIHPDSDYDFLIIYDGNLSKREVKLAIRQMFGLADIGMDLFVLSTPEYEWQKNVATTLGMEVNLTGQVVHE